MNHFISTQCCAHSIYPRKSDGFVFHFVGFFVFCANHQTNVCQQKCCKRNSVRNLNPGNLEFGNARLIFFEFHKIIQNSSSLLINIVAITRHVTVLTVPFCPLPKFYEEIQVAKQSHTLERLVHPQYGSRKNSQTHFNDNFIRHKGATFGAPNGRRASCVPRRSPRGPVRDRSRLVGHRRAVPGRQDAASWSVCGRPHEGRGKINNCILLQFSTVLFFSYVYFLTFLHLIFF